jgi:hypothetical protein
MFTSLFALVKNWTHHHSEGGHETITNNLQTNFEAKAL